MVEVFKTNVQDPIKAEMLILKICRLSPYYRVNFDLDDCDNILRVESKTGIIDSAEVNELIKEMGFQSEVLS